MSEKPDWHTRHYQRIVDGFDNEEFEPCLYCGLSVVRVEFSDGIDYLDREANCYCPGTNNEVEHKGNYNAK